MRISDWSSDVCSSDLCFDLSQGGRPIWEQRFSSKTGMTTDTQQAYAADQRDTVHAYNLADGHEVWKQAALGNRRLTSPAAVPQALALGDFEGYVHFLSRTDGQDRKSTRLNSSP